MSWTIFFDTCRGVALWAGMIIAHHHPDATYKGAATAFAGLSSCATFHVPYMFLYEDRSDLLAIAGILVSIGTIPRRGGRDMKRIFCVQPFGIRRHRLVPVGASLYPDLDASLDAGRRLARHRAGVVVLTQDVDTSSEQPGQPRVLAVHGTVPAPWRDLMDRPSAA